MSAIPTVVTTAPKNPGAHVVPPARIQVVRQPIQNSMPPEGQPFDLTPQNVATPAIGASAVIVQFTVPKGNNGYIKRIANLTTAGAFADFSGSLIWQIFLDFKGFDALGNGIGVVAPFYNAITASLGTAGNPSLIDGIKVSQGQNFALICKNIALVAGASFLGGRLGGYFYPSAMDPRLLF